MTLQQAQRLYPDAIQMKLTHLPYCVSLHDLHKWAKQSAGTDEVAILYACPGKTVSRVIYSKQAFKDLQTK